VALALYSAVRSLIAALSVACNLITCKYKVCVRDLKT
jgi:hypothetical protein